MSTLGDIPYRPATPSPDFSKTAADFGGSSLLIKQHTKSRTGCQTCKTRRIKCDEERPVCKRCKKAGFECDGYIAPEARKASNTKQRPHTKSRAGCVACKARRVKCDERKPSCSWCAKIQRPCEYPIQPIINVSHQWSVQRRSIRPQPPEVRSLKLNLAPGNGIERRSFEFYVVELGDMLTSSYDAEFWKGILIQRSCSEPALWHSLVSLSMLSELRGRGIDSNNANVSDRSRMTALWHYNRALQLSAESVATKDPSASDRLLINSILFTLIELLLVDVAKASVHLSSGIKLLENSRTKQEGVQPHQKDFLQGLLVPMFTHMESLAYLYDVRSAYEVLRDDINAFVETVTPAMRDHGTPANIVALQRQTELLQQSTSYIQFMQQVISRPMGVEPIDDEEEGIALMSFWFTVLQIKLHTSLSGNEWDFDEYMLEFTQAIEFAEGAINGVRRRGKKMTTSYLPDPEGMPMQFWIAWKCRNTDVRKQAIDLVKNSQTTFKMEFESYWITVLDRILDIEQNLAEASSGIIQDRRVCAIKVSMDSHSVSKKHVAFSYMLQTEQDIPTTVWIHEKLEV